MIRWAPGGTLTVEIAPFTWPTVFVKVVVPLTVCCASELFTEWIYQIQSNI
jgi:hypothetical protein